MKVHIQEVFRNMRYNFFEVDGVYYILEIKPSFWKYLFPFLYWFFPFPVYKIEDKKAIERIKIPDNMSMNKSSLVWSIGGSSVLVSTLLRGKIDDLTLSMPLSIKIPTVIFTIFCVVLIRLYITRAKQRHLYNKVDLSQLKKSYVKVKPQSFKHFMLVISFYVFFMFMSVLFFVTYFPLENIFLLLMANASLLALTFTSNIVVKEGWTTIKFIDE